MLYERQKEYDKIIECYLLDVSRRHQLFSYLHKIFCSVPERRLDFEKRIKFHLQVKLLLYLLCSFKNKQFSLNLYCFFSGHSGNR